ncbi:hypothetical protein DVA76_20160, partial [Acinetobacter baumannii]
GVFHELSCKKATYGSFILVELYFVELIKVEKSCVLVDMTQLFIFVAMNMYHLYCQFLDNCILILIINVETILRII